MLSRPCRRRWRVHRGRWLRAHRRRGSGTSAAEASSRHCSRALPNTAGAARPGPEACCIWWDCMPCRGGWRRQGSRTAVPCGLQLPSSCLPSSR